MNSKGSIEFVCRGQIAVSFRSAQAEPDKLFPGLAEQKCTIVRGQLSRHEWISAFPRNF